jgi:L,D-transpeptidase ErfK/SrfK
MSRDSWLRAAAAAAIVSLSALVSVGCSLRPSAMFGAASRPLSDLSVTLPPAGAPAPIVGEVQHHRVRRGETLLDIARAADLGYQAVQDANPTLDEWIPEPDADVLLPSRWILPPARYEGILINIPEMRLYYFPSRAQSGTEAEMHTWPIGIGTDETPSPIGRFTVRAKDENPSWVVPASIYKTMDNPRHVVPPGPDNPLGQYRLRLSYDSYEIHGSDTAWAIGRLTTHGCIRLYPEDIPQLFARVEVGTPGQLIYEPVKVGEEDGKIFLEVHPDLYGRIPDLEHHAIEVVKRAGLTDRIDRKLLRAAVRERRGIPVLVDKGSGGEREALERAPQPGSLGSSPGRRGES